MIAPSSLSPVHAAFEQQSDAFASAFGVLQDAISDRAFPAASVAVTHKGHLIVLKAFGTFTYERSSPAVNPETLFDLASLTKVVATTSMAMLLYERGLLELDAPVAFVIPEFVSDIEKDCRRRDVTFRMLLAHSSGLPAYEKLFLKASTREELLNAAFTMPLAAHPGSRAEYSDIGFILLGAALQRLADEPIDRFCQREVFAPLGMLSTTFNPPPEMRGQIPPTANDSNFRHRIIQGEVQDENVSILGGVGAQAGLFSTAADLAKLAHAMLNAGSAVFRPETVALFTSRQSTPANTSRALGWDTPSAPSQSGKYFGPLSFGHLGYTGTSLWIDPERQVSIILLTNRTWPDCSNHAIKQVRSKLHDAVIEALGSTHSAQELKGRRA